MSAKNPQENSRNAREIKRPIQREAPLNGAPDAAPANQLPKAYDPSLIEQQWAERWADNYQDWGYDVRARATFFDDPLFYGRARGGFGGVRAAPPGRPNVAAHPSAGVSAGGDHSSSAPYGGSTGRAYSGASPHVTSPGGG